MIVVIGISSLVLIGAGGLFYRAYPAFPFAVGVLLTSLLSALKVIMLERAVVKAAAIGDVATGKSYIRGQYFLRFLLTGFTLAAAAIAPDGVVSIWGAVAGVFTFQIAAMAVKFMKLDPGADYGF
jgi:hypothetical protein